MLDYKIIINLTLINVVILIVESKQSPKRQNLLKGLRNKLNWQSFFEHSIGPMYVKGLIEMKFLLLLLRLSSIQ